MRNRLAGLFLLTAGAAFAFPNPDGACSITTAGVLPQAVRGFPISYTISTAGCAAPMRFIEVRMGSLPRECRCGFPARRQPFAHRTRPCIYVFGAGD